MKKKLSRLLAVLLGVLMLAVCVPAAAFADEVDYRLESATIKVGEVWTMTLPKGNRYDWLLSSEYFHYGHNLPDKEGVLMQGDSIFEGDTITYTYKGVMPGTCTITLTDRSFAKIAEATVTVVEADETPVETPDETPAETPTEDKAVTMPAAADDSRPSPTAPGASSTLPARSAATTTGPARAMSMSATPAAMRRPLSSAPRV